jgi:mannosyltransferase
VLDRPAHPVAPVPVLAGRVGSALVGLAVLVLAAGLVAGVTSGPLWLDEALSVEIATVPLGELVGALRQDGAPPVYYLLLRAWTSVFGTGTVAVRLMTVALAPLVLLLAWRLGDRLGGRSGAVASVVVLAALPWSMRYLSETRMYGLVAALVLGLALLLLRVRSAPGRVPAAGAAVVAGLLLLTHYWALFLLAVVGGLALVSALRGSADDRRVVVALVCGGVLFLPWLPVFLFQAARTGAPWADPLVLAELVRTPRYWGGGGNLGRTVLAVLLVGLVVVGVRRVRAARLPALVALLTLLLAFTAVYVGGGAYTGRYTAVAVPLLAVAAGLGATALGRRGAVAALAAWLVVGAVTGIPAVARERTSGERVVDAFASAGGGSGELLAYCPDQLGPPVQRLLRQRGLDVEQVVYPTLAGPRRIDWVDYEQRQGAASPAAVAREIAARAGDRPVWLLSATEYRTFEGDCEAVRAELSRLRGPGELLFGREGTTGQLLHRYPAP